MTYREVIENQLKLTGRIVNALIDARDSFDKTSDVEIAYIQSLIDGLCQNERTLKANFDKAQMDELRSLKK